MLPNGSGAVSVTSLRSQCRPRWVLPLFLLSCALAKSRLYNTQPHDVTELKLCNSAKLWENSFAKYRTLRKNPQTQYSCGFADLFLQNDRFWKCLLTFWTTCYILYLSQILSVFAKYDTLRNFFMEKDAPRRPFVVFRVGPIGSEIGTTQFFLILFSLCRSSGHEKSAGICLRF